MLRTSANKQFAATRELATHAKCAKTLNIETNSRRMRRPHYVASSLRCIWEAGRGEQRLREKSTPEEKNFSSAKTQLSAMNRGRRNSSLDSQRSHEQRRRTCNWYYVVVADVATLDRRFAHKARVRVRRCESKAQGDYRLPQRSLLTASGWRRCSAFQFQDRTPKCAERRLQSGPHFDEASALFIVSVITQHYPRTLDLELLLASSLGIIRPSALSACVNCSRSKVMAMPGDFDPRDFDGPTGPRQL